MSSEPANQPKAIVPPAPLPVGGIPGAVAAHWCSEELLRGQKEVLIQHGSETYRLRLTRQGKLILYK